MGRRAHQPDVLGRRQVEAMAAYGVPEADIATVIGVDPKTLRRHYRQELDTGQIKANTKVAESLYKKALGDGAQSVTAAIFWLKTRARWKETVVNEVNVDTTDPIRKLMEEISENGNRIFDHAPIDASYREGWSSENIAGGCDDAAPAPAETPPSLITGG